MKVINAFLASSFAFVMVFGLSGSTAVFAAATPYLGTVVNFGVLSSTFTRNVGLTAITGDAGYTTLSGGGTDTVSGTTYQPATAQNGIDQGTALTSLNGQACTYTFPSGTVDLATDTTHGTIGVYTPGVYCTTGTGAASIGTGGITLSGSGTFIFRVNGALTSADNSIVAVANGASACNVFWTPTAATTLGSNTTFIGTDIDNSGITVGNTTTWLGQALAFGGTVTTDTDTITAPTGCTPSPATLHVVKQVVNTNLGVATPSMFNLHVKLSGTDVAGSPAQGMATPGKLYSLTMGTYVVSEDANSAYAESFSGACNSNGTVVLAPGDDLTCTVTNTAIVVSSSSGMSGSRGGGSTQSFVNTVATTSAPTVTTTTTTTTTVAPRLPNTGFPPERSLISSFLTMLLNLTK